MEELVAELAGGGGAPGTDGGHGPETHQPGRPLGEALVGDVGLGQLGQELATVGADEGQRGQVLRDAVQLHFVVLLGGGSAKPEGAERDFRGEDGYQ